MTTMILSDDYRHEQERLRADPIIIKMAGDLASGMSRNDIIAQFTHGDKDKPNHEFMSLATTGYVALCEKANATPRHRTIGGPAHAILALTLADES